MIFLVRAHKVKLTERNYKCQLTEILAVINIKLRLNIIPNS